MGNEDYAVLVAKAYQSLPSTQVRPVVVADKVLEGLCGDGYDPDDFSELRDIVTGMAAMLLSILADEKTRDIVLDAMEHSPAWVKPEVVH